MAQWYRYSNVTRYWTQYEGKKAKIVQNKSSEEIRPIPQGRAMGPLFSVLWRSDTAVYRGCADDSCSTIRKIILPCYIFQTKSIFCKDVQTWLLIGWWHSRRQPIRRQLENPCCTRPQKTIQRVKSYMYLFPGVILLRSVRIVQRSVPSGVRVYLIVSTFLLRWVWTASGPVCLVFILIC